MERAERTKREIEAKIAELGQVEASQEAQKGTKCFRPSTNGSGSYDVVARRKADEASGACCSLEPLRTSSASERRRLTAEDVSTKCAEDPECLWLSGEEVGDADVTVLCDALRRTGSQLTAIDLSRNVIADVGVQRLVSALAGGVCPNLRELWLDGNDFGELGAGMLTDGLAALRKNLKVHLGAAENGSREAASAPDSIEAAHSEDACRLGPASGLASESAIKLAEEHGPSAREGGSSAAPKAPDVEMLEPTDGHAGGVRVTVPLPENVSSVAELDLDVAPRRLRLCATATDFAVDVDLPLEVDTEAVKAVFSRKRRTMTVECSALVS